MGNENNIKTYRLEPSWKYYFWGYFWSVLAIPLLGAGLLGLYWVYRKQKKRSYTFTDNRISSYGTKYRRNIDLVNIESIKVRQSWIHRKLDVGTLVLSTSASEMKLIGIENPHKLQDILKKAIQSEVHRQKEKEKTRPREPEYDPGNMERLNYITGLWQQGLLSEEEYKKERKQLEG